MTKRGLAILMSVIMAMTAGITAQSPDWNYVMTIEPLTGSAQTPQAAIDMSRFATLTVWGAWLSVL